MRVLFYVFAAIVAAHFAVHALVFGWPIAFGFLFLGVRMAKRRGFFAGRATAAALPQTVWTPPAPVPSRAYAPRAYAPPPPPPQPAVKPLAPSAQIAARLDGLVERISKLVSNDVLSLVRSIVATIEEILPMLDSERHAVGDADAFTIRQTALHYLPDTMSAYFRLPPKYRTTQPLENGKTAREILIEQLTVLDRKMKEVAHNLASNDAQALLTNGRFLRERFATELFTTV